MDSSGIPTPGRLPRNGIAPVKSARHPSAAAAVVENLIFINRFSLHFRIDPKMDAPLSSQTFRILTVSRASIKGGF